MAGYQPPRSIAFSAVKFKPQRARRDAEVFFKHFEDSGSYNKQPNDWLLFAEKDLSPDPENIEHLFCHFEELAQ